MLQISNVNEKEAFLFFKNRLKPWVSQELKHGGAQELLKVMMIVEFVVKIGLGIDELESFKSKESGDDGGGSEEDIGNANNNTSNR